MSPRAHRAILQPLIRDHLAPADLRKEGPAYDLPIALGIIIANDQLWADVSSCLFVGELSLDGTVRHTDGILSLGGHFVGWTKRGGCRLSTREKRGSAVAHTEATNW